MQRLAALLVLVLLGVGGWIGWQYKTTGHWPDFNHIVETTTTMKNQVSEKSPVVTDATADASSQLETLAQRAGEVTQHAQTVLGSSIQVNEDVKKPIHESALEYGRYVYCKQVVTEYENSQQQTAKE